MRSALKELIDELNARSVSARIYIVGGAAMALGFGARDLTQDVDARYSPKDVVEEIAEAIGVRHGLPSGWLNNRAAMFISPVMDDPSPRRFMQEGKVEVLIASAEVMLAMKLRASRPRLDREDIRFLCHTLKISTTEEAIAVFKYYYPEDPLPSTARPILDEVLASGERSKLHDTEDVQDCASD
jgi:hypothetical protein